MNSLVLIFSLFAATGFALPTEPLTHPEPLTRVQRKDWCEGIKHLHLPDGSTRELEFLGYGGTGCAYKIKSYRIDDKEVVAKTYFPGKGESWELETRMLKKVEQYIDDFEDSHKRWILMNFVPGVDLRDLPGLEKFVGLWKHDPRQGTQLVRDPNIPREICEEYVGSIVEAMKTVVLEAAKRGAGNWDIDLGNNMKFLETYPDASIHMNQLPTIKATIVDWGQGFDEDGDADEVAEAYVETLQEDRLLGWDAKSTGKAYRICKDPPKRFEWKSGFDSD